MQGRSIFHASLVSSFDLRHPALPTSDSKFPGGPAWFSVDDETLAIWRAGQIAADHPDLLDNSERIYLHRYEINSGTTLMDLSDTPSKVFYDRLFAKSSNFDPKKEYSKGVVSELIDNFFKDYPGTDGLILKDSVSGRLEMILKNPSESLNASAGWPKSFFIDSEFSCFSCNPKRFLLMGDYSSFALIPDSRCDPGYNIKRLR